MPYGMAKPEFLHLLSLRPDLGQYEKARQLENVCSPMLLSLFWKTLNYLFFPKYAKTTATTKQTNQKTKQQTSTTKFWDIEREHACLRNDQFTNRKSKEPVSYTYSFNKSTPILIVNLDLSVYFDSSIEVCISSLEAHILTQWVWKLTLKHSDNLLFPVFKKLSILHLQDIWPAILK